MTDHTDLKARLRGVVHGIATHQHRAMAADALAAIEEQEREIAELLATIDFCTGLTPEQAARARSQSMGGSSSASGNPESETRPGEPPAQNSIQQPSANAEAHIGVEAAASRVSEWDGAPKLAGHSASASAPTSSAAPTFATERARLVAEVGECCQGSDPLCHGPAGCLVNVALAKRGATIPAPAADQQDKCAICGLTFAEAHKRETQAPAAEPVAWCVDLSCCGRDEGAVFFPSWELADQFRNSYTSGPGVNPTGYSAPPHEGGHRRAGIISALYGAPQPAQADEARELLREALTGLDMPLPQATIDSVRKRIRAYLARTGGKETK